MFNSVFLKQLTVELTVFLGTTNQYPRETMLLQTQFTNDCIGVRVVSTHFFFVEDQMRRLSYLWISTLS